MVAQNEADCLQPQTSSLELDLFEGLNLERSSRGIRELQPHTCAGLVATARAIDLAENDYFAHESPSGETATSLLQARAIPYQSAGENLARNNYPASQSLQVALDGLMESTGHRSLILDAGFTHLGVATAEDGLGMKYYVMILLKL